MKNKSVFYFLIILASSVFFFIPFLGKVHLFDWDEINFAESAREMIVTGDYSRVMINFQPFWEKPPFFFWLQAMSMHVFGINEFAARFPNAIFGIISLLTLYLIGKKTINERFGFIWALSYFGSFLPHLYFKSGIIDPVFNYFIFMGIYFMYKETTDQRTKKKMVNVLLSGLFIGLANLTKGPVGLLIFLLTTGIYWASKRFKKITSFRNCVIFIFSFSLVSFFWFGTEVLQHGIWFLKGFITYQISLFTTPVAGHQGPLYYHFVVILLGCFPISIFALPVLLTGKSDSAGGFTSLTRILFWVVLILFTIVTTKIVHYSSLCYFPLSFLAATYIYKLINDKVKMAGYVFWLLIVLAFIFSILLISLPLIASHKEWLLPYLKDPFAAACLQMDVRWGGFEIIIGVIYCITILTLIIKMKQNAAMKNFIALFYTTALCLFLYLITVVPKIESYTQAPAINFYKSMAGKDVDVISVGFYSYAKFFYFEKPFTDKYKTEMEEQNYLLGGNIARPAYFVVKITNTNFPKEHPDCKLIMQEGGFLFYERLPH